MNYLKLEAKLTDILKRKRTTLKELNNLKRHSHNSAIQNIEMRSRIDAEITVLISVLDAINGNDYNLNCY